LLENYTVGKNIGLALELQDKLDQDLINDVLKQVDLEGFYHRFPDELSGGERQRVAIARALAKKSNIILADEPAASLDEVTRKEIYTLFRKIAKEKLVIIASHDLDNAKKMADQIIRLHQGEIIDVDIISQNQNSENIIIDYLKPKFSFKNIILNAGKIFSGKPIRMFLNFLLFSIILSVFGFFMSVIFLDKEKIIFNAVDNQDIKDIAISKQSSSRDDYINLTLEDAEIIGNLTSKKWYYIYDMEDPYFWDNLHSDPSRDYEYYVYDYHRFNGIMGLNREISEELNFVLKAGTYPEKRSDDLEEIVVSEYLFELFQYWGFDKYSLEGPVDINGYSDLIGRKLKVDNKKYYISGIIETNSNIDKFTFLKTVSKSNPEFESFLLTSPDLFLYTREDYPVDLNIKYLYTPINNLSKSDLKTLLDLHYSESFLIARNYLIHDIDLTTADLLRLQNIFIISIVILSIFSIVLLINHIRYSLTFNHKYFGILRSLGASKTNLILIYLFIGIVIILVTLGIGIFGLSLINDVINNYKLADNVILDTIFRISFESIILMLIFNILAIGIAIVFPVLRMLSKNNIELINRKE
jgi:ABC-type proline/glycine betaine transport system ATPase subunit